MGKGCWVGRQPVAQEGAPEKETPAGCTGRGFGNWIHQPRAMRFRPSRAGRLVHVMMMVVENHWIEGRLMAADRPGRKSFSVAV
jgi:hypothetical protein